LNAATSGCWPSWPPLASGWRTANPRRFRKDRSPARPWLSPEAWPRCREARPRRPPPRQERRSPPASARRPTSWWSERTRVRSSKRPSSWASRLSTSRSSCSASSAEWAIQAELLTDAVFLQRLEVSHVEVQVHAPARVQHRLRVRPRVRFDPRLERRILGQPDQVCRDLFGLIPIHLDLERDVG